MNMSKNPTIKCPHCGNNEEYYTKDYVHGSCRTYARFDGKEADNSEMYIHLNHEQGKYAYCTKCRKRLFKIRK